MNNILGKSEYSDIHKKLKIRLAELQKKYDDNTMKQLDKK